MLGWFDLNQFSRVDLQNGILQVCATRANRFSGFPTRSDTNRPVQPQKIARNLKFGIEEKEEPYYPCSENKGADQLCSYCTADLRLSFRIGKNPVFSFCGSNTSFSVPGVLYILYIQ